MKPYFTLLLASAAFSSLVTAAEWTPLLDDTLSKWEVFISVPQPTLTVPGYTHAADPKADVAVGLRDPLKVFSIRPENGEPVLHVTGEIFGGLTSLTEHENFHIRMQFRWGSVRHEPRLDKPRDSGFLYHCSGPHGVAAKVWKSGLECQIQENDIGDFYSLGGYADVPAVKGDPVAGKPDPWSYSPGAALRSFKGRCSHGRDYQELPNGEWNTIEIIAIGDRALHLLNGKVINVLQNTYRLVDDKKVSLTCGQIQLQSEGAECDYRRVEIRSIAAFPPEFSSLFQNPSAP